MSERLDIALAGSSRLASEAGARIAAQGGNATDAAIAAILVSMCTEPAVVGLGAGGFVTVALPDGDPVTIDGYVEMPGRGLPADRMGRGCQTVHVGYGGGVTTVVGPGSVGTPGALAALEETWCRYGRIDFAELFQPAIDWVRTGFPMPAASHRYLVHAHEKVFGWDDASRAALHHPDGALKGVGQTVHVAGLEATLEELAQGTATLYGGALGKRITDAVQDAEGILTLRDLAEYEPVVREPVRARLGDWSFSTNPPPALGGAVLAAMLQHLDHRPADSWTRDELLYLIQVQEAVLTFRADRLEASEDLPAAVRELLSTARPADLRRLMGSPSTVQASAVDSSGLACSISVSTGYGSGMMPAGTGIWLNNSLGEIELNPKGIHAESPGTRLHSNMAPTVGRRSDGAVIAIASPGASRITTALAQVLVNLIPFGLSLDQAVAHPRLHVELSEEGTMVAAEPGLDVDGLGYAIRHFKERSMFFGGVGVAVRSPDGDMRAAADDRRAGGAVVARS